MTSALKVDQRDIGFVRYQRLVAKCCHMGGSKKSATFSDVIHGRPSLESSADPFILNLTDEFGIGNLGAIGLDPYLE